MRSNDEKSDAGDLVRIFYLMVLSMGVFFLYWSGLMNIYAYAFCSMLLGVSGWYCVGLVYAQRMAGDKKRVLR